MTLDTLTIRIDTPSDSLPPGRGFYQIEEDILFVPIGPQHHGENAFFSFLESDSVRMDIDRTGKLLFIEISRSRRLWKLVPDLIAPTVAPYADIRWLDFREQFAEPHLLTNAERNLVCIQFSDRLSTTAHRLAESVLVESDAANVVTRLWVAEIIDDLAGRQITSFRRPDQESS